MFVPPFIFTNIVKFLMGRYDNCFVRRFHEGEIECKNEIRVRVRDSSLLSRLESSIAN